MSEHLSTVNLTINAVDDCADASYIRNDQNVLSVHGPNTVYVIRKRGSQNQSTYFARGDSSFAGERKQLLRQCVTSIETGPRHDLSNLNLRHVNLES